MIVSAWQDTSRDPGRGPGRNPQPWGGDQPPPGREPVFNAPPQALVLVVLIVVGYAIQSITPVETVLRLFAFFPAGLPYGRWETLATALFVHGGWAHALMNAAFALAFGAPLARFLGPRVAGWLWFYGFYLLCGVGANLAFYALHASSTAPLVGASGAISGLMGAACRLLGGHGRVGRLTSRPVVTMGLVLLAVNVAVGLLGSAFVPGADGAQIAWEAHVAGFVLGVLLIAPVARLSGRG